VSTSCVARAAPLASLFAATLVATLASCGARTGVDALPGAASATDAGGALDATPSDAPGTPPDAASCPDGGPLDVVYAMDGPGVLYRYDPVTNQSTQLGAPDCGNGNVPWTITASRDAVYVVYTDWTLYRVDPATLRCTGTPFDANQVGLDSEFGVAAFGSGAGERLFVYGVPAGGPTPILAVADTISFALTKVGDVVPAPHPGGFPVNLTADNLGHLYAFAPFTLGPVLEIDQTSGAVLQSVDTGVTTQSTWATIAYGTRLFLWVDDRVVGYDLAAHAQTGTRDAGFGAIGAGSFPACP